MPPTNSKNCVARTTVYGIGEALINFSWATFARKYPLAGSRSQPTIESATWWPTPVFFSAARRLRVEVSKNSSTALSSQEGAFVTSTTTCAPINALVKPSPVIELMPSEGDAAMTSRASERSKFTSFAPIKPVPPRTTIFIIAASSSRYRCLPKRFSVAEHLRRLMLYAISLRFRQFMMASVSPVMAKSFYSYWRKDVRTGIIDEASGPALKCVSVLCHGTRSELISVSLDLVAGGQSLKFLQLVATP